MNCKQGDLAFFLPRRGISAVLRASTPASNPGTPLGAVVRVVRYAYAACTEPNTGLVFKDIWEVDPPMCGSSGNKTPYCPDEFLRPIKGEPGADETLAWKSVPSPEHV